MAGASIRLYPLSSRSLWFDEAFTWRLIDYPRLEMLDRATRDNSPPFYYFVLKGWSELFGVSPVALRALSVLCGLLTIVGTYVFCLEAFGRRWSAGAKADADDEPIRRARGIGLLAAGLVAVSALQIRYSVEVRMYALAAALTVFSGWALLRALRDGAAWGAWLVYAVLAALLSYTHYFGLYTLAGHAVFAGCLLWAQAEGKLTVFFRRPQVWDALGAGAVVFVVWLPWLGVFCASRSKCVSPVGQGRFQAGSSPTFAIACSSATAETVTLSRSLRPGSGNQFSTCRAKGTESSQEFSFTKTFPAHARTGTLRIKRTGSTVSYLVAEAKAKEFAVLYDVILCSTLFRG